MDSSEIAAHVANLRDLDKLVIVNQRGEPAVWIGWIIALFFENGETLEKRLLANRVLRDFLATFGKYITHYDPVDANRLREIGDLDVAAYSDRNAEEETARDGRDGNDFYVANIYGFPGGKEVVQPAPFYLAIAATYRARPAASYIVANFPLTWFPPGDDLTPVVDLFLRWCGIVKPAHGTASPGLVFTQGGSPRSDFLSAYPLIQRFPGLDYVDAARWRAQNRADLRKIRTIGWLTAIDDGFVGSLGGTHHIRNKLGPDIPINPFPGGLVIQAGPEPRLGDRNRGDVPAPYRAVARLVDPLVFKAFRRGVFLPPAPLDAAQETQKWLHRFD